MKNRKKFTCCAGIFLKVPIPAIKRTYKAEGKHQMPHPPAYASYVPDREYGGEA
jgi:hypothetical protein